MSRRAGAPARRQEADDSPTGLERRATGRLTVAPLSGSLWLRHGFFTRRGGISPPPFDSLNLSTATGDSPANTAINAQIIRREMGLTALATTLQVHGVDIVRLDGPNADGGELIKADGMVTDTPGLGLLLKVADCQALLVADPVHRAVGAVHIGWRGLVADGASALVRAMTEHFGSRPADLRAGLGASLGPCCAEFINYRSEIPEKWWPYGDHRHHFDLPAIARAQLISAGLAGDNIETVGMCTRCRGDLFFSHRGQGSLTGRLGAVIGLVPHSGE